MSPTAIVGVIGHRYWVVRRAMVRMLEDGDLVCRRYCNGWQYQLTPDADEQDHVDSITRLYPQVDAATLADWYGLDEDQIADMVQVKRAKRRRGAPPAWWRDAIGLLQAKPATFSEIGEHTGKCREYVKQQVRRMKHRGLVRQAGIRRMPDNHGPDPWTWTLTPRARRMIADGSIATEVML